MRVPQSACFKDWKADELLKKIMEELQLPVLNAEECRVLGCLMEKSRTTPEYYPMTVNGLMSACNQKTSRHPVVNYDEHTVIHALDSLRKKGLVSTATGGGSRVTKYKHNFAIVYPLVPADLAVICLLLLRGPLTAGEINNLSTRLYSFDSIAEVQEVLDKLMDGDLVYVKQLSKRAGQKEVRYVHLLAGDVSEDELVEDSDSVSPANHSSLENRLRAIEEELAILRKGFDQLKDLL